MMNYNLVSTRPNSYFLFEKGDKVFLEDCVNNAKLLMTHNCIDPVWEFEGEEKSAQYVYDGRDCVIVYNQRKSTFINVHNGCNEGSENRYYFLKNDNVCVYIDMQDSNTFIIENGHQFRVLYQKSNKWFFSNYMIDRLYSSNTLLCTDLYTGKELWKISFDALGIKLNDMALEGSISFYKDTIFFFAEGSGTDFTLCMDIKTGEIIRRYPGLRGFNSIENDTLYNLFFDKLHTLHIPSGTEKTYDLKPVFSGNKIERADYWRWSVQQGLLYFTDNSGADKISGIRGAKMGVLDINKEEIAWLYTLPVKSGLIGGINVTGNRIYVSTQDFMLYIFER